MRRALLLSLLLAGFGSLAPADEAALAPVPALDSYAVVGEPKCRYLWILSRSPRMPEPLYAGILARAARFYDISRVRRTEQREAPAPAP